MTDASRIVRFSTGLVTLAALDLVTKRWAVSALSDGPRHLPGPIDLQLSYNSGTAFGLFSGLPSTVVSAVTAAFVVVVLNMWRVGNAPTTPALLVGAGGLANVVDRIQGGGVVDMLHTGWWPTFNLADIFITAGVAWWMAATVSSSNDDNQSEPSATQSGRDESQRATS